MGTHVHPRARFEGAAPAKAGLRPHIGPPSPVPVVSQGAKPRGLLRGEARSHTRGSRNAAASHARGSAVTPSLSMCDAPRALRDAAPLLHAVLLRLALLLAARDGRLDAALDAEPLRALDLLAHVV